MNVSDELIKLIETVVDKKINAQMLKVKNITSSGDLALTSMGDIHIRAGLNKKAYYNGVEIGSGSGTDHGALTGLGDDDHSIYLLLTAGSTRKLTGALYINMTTPSIALQTAADTKMAIQWDGTDSVITSYYGKVIIDPPTGSTVDLRVNNVTKLAVGGSGITAAVDLYINKASPAIRFLDATGVDTYGYLIATPTLTLLEASDGHLYLDAATSAKEIYLQTQGVTKLTIGSGAITSALTLAMSGTKITDLAAGSVAGDALSYEQLITDHGLLTGLGDDDHTQYLLLTAGSGRKLTGTLYINNNNPIIYLEYSALTRGTILANNTTFQIYSTSVPIYIGDVDLATTIYGSSIALATGVTPTTRLTIADAALTCAVDLVLGSNKLRGTAGGGSDVILGDDLSGLKAASTYADIKNIGTITPGATDTKDLGSSSLYWNEVYAQIYYVDDASTKITNSTGNLVFTVAAGKKFQFVVSA